MEREDGNTMLIVLLMLLVLTGIGASLLTIATVDVDIAGNQRTGETALYTADAGMREGMETLSQDIASGTVSLTNNLTDVIVESNLKTIANGTGDPRYSYQVQGSLAFNEQLVAVDCDLVGQNMAEGAGRRRFRLISTGRVYPPGVTLDPTQAFAEKQIEVIMQGPLEYGVCPPPPPGGGINTGGMAGGNL